ncbi:hypothetical protein N658DRAFT_498351 [Parathielavia hyrcaniae]|uniref:Uncharacterized protein n=1 Tax=Parathielavia hyrcaniae TaxID=113614 RepID=A0AAN6PYH3_9PEZI|nr:hypothetical protein N658DRAFT_498351 [Parathielavia hyrcaniae]
MSAVAQLAFTCRSACILIFLERLPGSAPFEPRLCISTFLHKPNGVNEASAADRATITQGPVNFFAWKGQPRTGSNTDH